MLCNCKGESESVGLGGIADLYAGGRFEEVEARFVMEEGAESEYCLGGDSVKAERDSCEMDWPGAT